jgi:hypothetical protein
MSLRVLRKSLAVGLAWSAVMTATATPPEKCGVCDRRLGRQAWTYAGIVCCSQECVDQQRPVCSVCQTVLRGKYHMANDRLFCSDACFDSTLDTCEICKTPIREGFSITRHRYCKNCGENQPACFSCGLPAAHPTRLPDGREICNGCMRWAVKTQEMAQRHFDRARRQLEAWTGIKIETVPKLVLVDRTEMRKLSKKLRKTDSAVSIRGLYSRQTLVRRNLFGVWKTEPDHTIEKIYIVDHLNDEVFRVAATHELMHDLIHEQFPRLREAPLWVHEGLCQQAAAELCRRRNYADTLHGIEECKDPDYGDGYRYINMQTGFSGWRALRRWMETVDIASLPRAAPKF